MKKSASMFYVQNLVKENYKKLKNKMVIVDGNIEDLVVFFLFKNK